jgi:carbon monoxide dehydrogenase subunit G
MSAVDLGETFVVEAPLASLWPLLRDPHVIAACMPGTELTGENDDGSFEGRITLRFGPTTATFAGTAVITLDDAIEARGRDGKGSTRASASIEVRLEAAGERCDLHVRGGIDVAGPLAQFARTGGTQVVKVLLGEFSQSLARRASDGAPTDGDASGAATAATPTRTLSVGHVVRLLLRDWWARGRERWRARRRRR